ncbi:ABC-2 type transport system ATP-binding protein [Actinokineospora alba]|uniref:ABC-2 type transport system ATP-binding protein n=1 Tax=Actinokineospora alba TaxID=504798 RepID=A0A1H0HF29_9PSEU|nr:ABC transporter ATP-binding protein [Actinokineospora alba]TDP64913.1 ABC-2 type transport system ATP-binding protein [Actinokineospora alba]SDH49239.1 ABC-2 type transport system ATP-binding protein [Actinokineospora alba]SDO17683.1 ABC-2 type transport system ATP-binding protein [Actinokineospora alba]
MSAPVLSVEAVSVDRGGRRVLHDVSLDVSAGQIVALLGPNGAGKTTLMDAITGRVPLAGGSVRVGGDDLATAPRACRRRIGYAGQEIAVFPTLTVTENVASWAAVSGVARAARTRAVDDVLRLLFLQDLAHRPVRELSGGERRRVHCAMAMVARPPVLLLDEPTVGVDPMTRSALLDHLTQLADGGTAVLYSTHYLHEVEKRAAVVVMLREGKVVASGQADELISRHCTSVIEMTVERGGETRTVVVPTSDAVTDLARLLDGLRADGDRLVGVEVRRPSLEDAFTHIVSTSEVAHGR